MTSLVNQALCSQPRQSDLNHGYTMHPCNQMPVRLSDSVCVVAVSHMLTWVWQSRLRKRGRRKKGGWRLHLANKSSPWLVYWRSDFSRDHNEIPLTALALRQQREWRGPPTAPICAVEAAGETFLTTDASACASRNCWKSAVIDSSKQKSHLMLKAKVLSWSSALSLYFVTSMEKRNGALGWKQIRSKDVISKI